jgi:hypothetical protein
VRLFTAYWVRQEEGEVRWSDNFHSADWILKADALKDVIHILEDEYNKLFLEENWRKP